jgi:hypothetical protein
MNVRWRITSRRVIAGEFSRETATAAAAAEDVGCGRWSDESAMKPAGDERERLGRAFETGPEGFAGRRKDFVDQV